jgi:Glycine zipper
VAESFGKSLLHAQCVFQATYVLHVEQCLQQYHDSSGQTTVSRGLLRRRRTKRLRVSSQSNKHSLSGVNMSTDRMWKLAIVLPVCAIALGGCQSSGGNSSAMLPAGVIGAGLGALVGSAVGGNDGAIIGAIAGGGIGLLVGAAIDEANKEAAISNRVVVKTESDGSRVTSRPVRTYKRGNDTIRVVRTVRRKPSGETQTVEKENRLIRSASGEITDVQVL